MKHCKHLLSFWRRRDRRRMQILAEARRRDQAEAEAAIARILELPTA